MEKIKKGDNRSFKPKRRPTAKPREYLLFVDLKKAFDSVDRAMLLRLLKNAGANDRLVRALRSLYDGMAL